MPLPPTIRALTSRLPALPANPVAIRGWVRSWQRRGGDLHFLRVNDGSDHAGIQVVLRGLPRAALVDDNSMSTMRSSPSKSGHPLSVGASVEVVGDIVPSEGGEQQAEVQVELGEADWTKRHRLHVFGTADPSSYPLQPKRHSPEYLREKNAHLRVRTAVSAATMRVRSAAAERLQHALRQQDFIQVHTPIITASDCEGGGDAFRVEAPGDKANDRFFRSPSGAHLTVSGQLHGEALAAGLGRIYTFGPTFRAERDSHTPRHLAEFWMLEPEISFASNSDAMDVCEDVLQATLQHVGSAMADELAVLEKLGDFGRPLAKESDTHDRHEHQHETIMKRVHDAGTEQYVRISYTAAQAELSKAHDASGGTLFQEPPKSGNDLRREHEKWLCETMCNRVPVFVTDWPESLKPFYMLANDDESNTVANFDLLFPEVGEIAGGSAREHRLDKLEKHKTPQDLAWYRDLRRFGTVPHAGFGIGFDRLVQFLSGRHNIRDVIPFPRSSGVLHY